MTFKELAEYINTLPEKVQNQEACFTDLLQSETVSLWGENVKLTKVVERGFAPFIFGAPCCYLTIATSDEEIEEEYDY